MATKFKRQPKQTRIKLVKDGRVIDAPYMIANTLTARGRAIALNTQKKENEVNRKNAL